MFPLPSSPPSPPPNSFRYTQWPQGGHPTGGTGGTGDDGPRLSEQSETEMWGSAITDHTMKENHAIDWDSAKIVERERDDQARGIKEAEYILSGFYLT